MAFQNIEWIPHITCTQNSAIYSTSNDVIIFHRNQRKSVINVVRIPSSMSL